MTLSKTRASSKNRTSITFAKNNIRETKPSRTTPSTIIRTKKIMTRHCTLFAAKIPVHGTLINIRKLEPQLNEIR